MRIYILLLAVITISIGCSTDDEIYTKINGRVETIVNHESVTNHKVTVRTRKTGGSGLFSRIVEIDSKEVTTDENGNFSLSLKTENDAFATITHRGDENHSSSRIFTDYSLNEPILIRVHKLITVRVQVTNTTPYDDNDYVSLRTVTNSLQTSSEIRIAEIINLGLPNEDRPENPSFGHNGKTIWQGQNVQSIIEYKVPEITERLFLNWSVRKNEIWNNGSTSDIPLQPNQTNNFVYEY